MAIEYYDSLNVASTAASNFAGDVLIEDNLYLTDAGTTRAKIQLNSSDRDDLDINAVSLGSNIKFFTVDAERMRIDASGNIGIGITSPSEKLDVNGTVNLTNLKIATAQGTDGQVLTSTGSGVAWEDVSGGSSPWTTDTNGITYTAGNVGIGMASVAGIDLAVDGLVRFYNQLRVNSNTQMDGELSVLDSTSLSGDLSLNGNDILTEGGDILDSTDSAGAVNSFLISKGTGNGIRWVPVTAATFDAVTSVTTGEPSGSDSLINIVSLTQAEYDAGTPVATTLYIIT